MNDIFCLTLSEEIYLDFLKVCETHGEIRISNHTTKDTYVIDLSNFYGKWINVKTKLPNYENSVLVLAYQKCRVAWLNKKDKWENDEDYDIKVTHWMPLPDVCDL